MFLPDSRRYKALNQHGTHNPEVRVGGRCAVYNPTCEDPGGGADRVKTPLYIVEVGVTKVRMPPQQGEAPPASFDPFRSHSVYSSKWLSSSKCKILALSITAFHSSPVEYVSSPSRNNVLWVPQRSGTSTQVAYVDHLDRSFGEFRSEYYFSFRLLVGSSLVSLLLGARSSVLRVVHQPS